MANRFPLVVDTSDSNKIKELPSGDNLQLSGNDVVGVVNITGSGTLTIESVSATNISLDGTSLADVATSGSYNDLTNTPSNVSTFTNDSNYVTPGSNISLFTNDAGYLTTVAFADITDAPTTLAEYGITDAATISQGVKADSAVQPGSNISTFNNDAGYITLTNIQNGDLTIDVNNSGDLIGSVFGQDSTILVDAILSSVNVSGTIRGHVLPRAGAGGLYDIGSAEDQFKDIHISGQLNGNVDGDVTGSVFADNSTLLVDGVNGKIVGPIGVTTFEGNGAVSFNNDYYSDTFYGGFTTDKPILNIRGADYVGGGDDGGGITIAGGSARNGGNNGDVIIASGAGGADGTGYISLLSDYITAAGTWIGTQTMDIKGSVFADDSTLLVDGVSGTIPASVVSGTITNDISTNSLETTTDIRFGTYADARKPKIGITGIGEHDIAITAGYDVGGNDSGNVSINANTDGATPGVVNIATSSGQLSLGKSSGTTDVFGEVEFHGRILFQDGDGVDFNGPVDFSDATITGLLTANNSGVAYQYGYSAYDAVSTAGGDFSVNSTSMSVSLTATNLAQGARIDISGITSNTSAGTGLIYIQRRVNTGSWNVWNAFVVDGAGDHFSHSFVDFYDTGGTTFDISAGDTVEYKLSNATENSSYNGNSAGAVDFELFFGFQFTATEIPVSYSLTQP